MDEYIYHRQWIGARPRDYRANARRNWQLSGLVEAERYMLDAGLTLADLHERGTVRLAHIFVRATRRTAAARIAANR